jgi:hypothetical protein
MRVCIGGTPVWLKYPDKDAPDSGPIGVSWPRAFGGDPYFRDIFSCFQRELQALNTS